MAALRKELTLEKILEATIGNIPSPGLLTIIEEQVSSIGIEKFANGWVYAINNIYDSRIPYNMRDCKSILNVVSAIADENIESIFSIGKKVKETIDQIGLYPSRDIEVYSNLFVRLFLYIKMGLYKNETSDNLKKQYLNKWEFNCLQ